MPNRSDRTIDPIEDDGSWDMLADISELMPSTPFPGVQLPSHKALVNRRRNLSQFKRSRRNRGGKKPAGGKHGSRGNRGAGNTVIDDVDLGPDLPAFGQPNTRRVDSIVNSILSDATREYRDANRQALRDLGRDTRGIASAGREFDIAAQRFGSATNRLGGQQQRQRIVNQAALDAMMNRYRSDAAQAAQSSSTPLEYAVNSGQEAAGFLQDQMLSGADQRDWQHMLQAERLANRRDAAALVADAKRRAREVLSDNRRSIAEERAKRASTRLGVEKQLWDMHIARRLAEAEHGGGQEQIRNARFERGAAQRGLSNDSSSGGRGGSGESPYKKIDTQRAYEILRGTQTKTKEPTILYPDPDDPASGKIAYVDQVQYTGQPATVREAIQMLAGAGLTGKFYQNLARQWMSEQNRQAQQAQNISDIQRTAQDIAGMFR